MKRKYLQQTNLEGPVYMSHPQPPERGFEVNFLLIRAAFFPGGSWQMKIIYKN
jgi:hypothetical protein